MCDRSGTVVLISSNHQKKTAPAAADKTEDKTMMKALNMNELEKVVGGSVLDEVFKQYIDYLNSLFEKYNVRGIKNVKRVCTDDEKNEIHEMWNEVMRVSSRPELCR